MILTLLTLLPRLVRNSFQGEAAAARNEFAVQIEKDSRFCYEMRNYQTLTLIGGILGMLISFGVYATFGVLDITMTSLQNISSSGGSTSSQTAEEKAKRRSDLNMISLHVGIAIVLYINSYSNFIRYNKYEG